MDIKSFLTQICRQFLPPLRLTITLISGSILEDEKVIGTLETLKSEAAEIQQKVGFLPLLRAFYHPNKLVLPFLTSMRLFHFLYYSLIPSGRGDRCGNGGSGVCDEYLPSSLSPVFWNILCHGDSQSDPLSLPILAPGSPLFSF